MNDPEVDNTGTCGILKCDTDSHVERLVASIMADISPHVAMTPRCRETLTQSVAIALKHAWQMVDHLAEPLALGQHLWTSNPYLPVLFTNTQECLDVVRDAVCVKKVFSAGDVESCFMFMTMHRHEYVTLGSELRGEIITRDVQQHVVEFIDHRVPFAASTLKELRQALVDSIVLYLAGIAPRRIHDLQATQTEIMHAEELLKAQIHTLEQTRGEYRSFSVPRDVRAKLLRGEAELAILEQKRSTVTKALDSSDCLAEASIMLETPHDYLHLEHTSVRVGDFGIACESGKQMQFQEWVYGNGQRHTVLLASIDCKTALRLWPELGPPEMES